MNAQNYRNRRPSWASPVLLCTVAGTMACGLSFDVAFDPAVDSLALDATVPLADSSVSSTQPSDGKSTDPCENGRREDGEADIDCGGSCARLCPLGARCNVSGDCSGETVCRSGICTLPETCKALHDARPTLPSGSYRLASNLDAGSAGSASGCDMTTMGGGWTLVLKVDGAKETFTYDSPLWTSDALLAPDQTALDSTEAKLVAFHDVAFTEVALSLETTDQSAAVVLPVAAKSFAALISRETVTMLGRETWLGLVNGASLQANCNAEGFSIVRGSIKVRIGIIANNEDNCGGPDSFLGVGTGGALCGHQTRAGNVACYNGTAGDRNIPAFARVLVR